MDYRLLTVGTRVRVIRRVFRATPDMVGIVRVAPQSECESIGVVYPTNIDGHSLNGNCVNGYGEFVEIPNILIVGPDETVEVKEGYTYCSFCSKYEPISEMEEFPNEVYACQKCLPLYFQKCDKCHKWVRNGSRYFIHGVDDTEVYVCHSCFCSMDYYQCADCGGRYIEELEVHDCSRYCHHCIESARNRNAIHGYEHTQCNLKFYGNKDTVKPQRYYGIELEVDHDSCDNDRYTCARQLKEHMENGYLISKEDSSLNNGFEIVTMPATYNYHKSQLEAYTKVVNTLLEYDFKSHDTDTAGLHVHVNKNSFANWELVSAKIIILMANNWDDMVRFSRRNYDELDEWAKKNNYDDGDTTREIINSNENDRYKALNITNYNTIEFRLFKGTLKIEALQATLEFVKRICAYAEKTPLTKIVNATWNDIFDGASANFKSYQKERGIK